MILLRIVKMLPKSNIHKYFMQGRNLYLKFLLQNVQLQLYDFLFIFPNLEAC